MNVKLREPIVLLLVTVIMLTLAACQPAPAPAQPAPEATMPALEEPTVGDEEEGARGTLPDRPAPDRPAVDEILDRPLAYVDSAVLQVDSATNGASLLVAGNLADGCTFLGDVQQVFVDERLTISLYTTRDPDLMCTQALVPFQTTVVIDAPVSVQDLTGGRIPITVNGVPVSQTE